MLYGRQSKDLWSVNCNSSVHASVNAERKGVGGGASKKEKSIWEYYFIIAQDLTFLLQVITENLLPLQQLVFIKSFILFTKRNKSISNWDRENRFELYFLFYPYLSEWGRILNSDLYSTVLLESPVLKLSVKPMHAQKLPKAKENISTNVHQHSDSLLKPLSWLVDHQGQADI